MNFEIEHIRAKGYFKGILWKNIKKAYLVYDKPIFSIAFCNYFFSSTTSTTTGTRSISLLLLGRWPTYSRRQTTTRAVQRAKAFRSISSVCSAFCDSSSYCPAAKEPFPRLYSIIQSSFAWAETNNLCYTPPMCFFGILFLCQKNIWKKLLTPYR